MYNNKFWEVSKTFKKSSQPSQSFDLDPGEYLFICNGARGGKGSYGLKQPGGTSYGVLNLSETTSFHAVVGNDGYDSGLVSELYTDFDEYSYDHELFKYQEHKWVNIEYPWTSSSGTMETDYTLTLYPENDYGETINFKMNIAVEAYDVNDNPLWARINFFESYFQTGSCPLKSGRNKGWPSIIFEQFEGYKFSISLYKLPAEDEIYDESHREPIHTSDVKSVKLCFNDNTVDLFGYNGGANGSRGYSTYYERIGAGGGGATDIRLLPPKTMAERTRHLTVPSEFQEIEYIDSSYNGKQWLDTGYVFNPNTRYEALILATDHNTSGDPDLPTRTGSYRWEVAFGSRVSDYNHNAYVFFTRFNNAFVPCYSLTGYEITGSDFTYNTQIRVNTETANGNKASWYKEEQMVQQDYPIRTAFPEIGEINVVYYDRMGDESYLWDPKINDYVPTFNGDHFYWDKKGDVSIPYESAIGNGVSTTTLFDVNNATDKITPSVDSSGYSVLRFYSFKIYESENYYSDDNLTLKHYFVPVRRPNNEYNYDVSVSDFEQGTISSSGDTESTKQVRLTMFLRVDDFKGSVEISALTNDDYQLSSRIIEYKAKNISKTYITRVNNVKTYGTGQTFYTQASNYFRIVLTRPDSGVLSPADIKSVHIHVSNAQAGMFDLVDQLFHSNRHLSNDFIRGADVADGEGTAIDLTETYDQSLYTRIMVAGGGGGGTSLGPSASYTDSSGFGGGIYGGPLSISTNDLNAYKFASQNDGYSFGNGMTPPTRVNYQEPGSGGGGGGWYGGYATDSNSLANTIGNGGGGSGYVLTSTSFKPEDYIPDSKYYFENIMMDVGSSDEASVVICKRVKRLHANDHITIPKTGSVQTCILPPGEYLIKCYGGDGGTRSTNGINCRGGYSSGILTLQSGVQAFFHVAGSGRYAGAVTSTKSYVQVCNPTLGYNGGGTPINTTSYVGGATAGAGATDIRFEADTYNNRVIVAGGSGGSGSEYGGSGGGETGEAAESGRGTKPGPGTQTGSPNAGSSRTDIQGGFGYGGGGVYRSGGYGGAGGAGWYGGCGCYPDSSDDDDAGGSGGSGYVLTAESFKPEGYAVDKPEYYFTEPETVIAGNNLPVGTSKIVIDVYEAGSVVKLLAHDSSGYKYFDTVNEEWVLLGQTTPTVEDFNTYGSYNIINDVGLDTNYQILAYDEDDEQHYCSMNVVPPELIVTRTIHSDTTFNSFNVASSAYKNDQATITTELNKNQDGTSTLRFNINKLRATTITDEAIKVYNVEAFSDGNGKNSSRYIPPKTPIEPKTRNLLKTGTGDEIISKRYKTSYLDGGSVVASSVQNFCSVVYDMTLYCAVLINSSTIRFLAINVYTGNQTIIVDVPSSSLGGSCGSILVDDNYIYFTPYQADPSSSYLYTISLKDLNIESYQTNSGSGRIGCRGKMQWFDARTIIMGNYTGFVKFDTVKHEYSYNNAHNISDIDCCLGSHTFIKTYTSTVYLYDFNTETWSSISVPKGDNYAMVCYADGKYYVVRKNYICILDEETKTFERSIVITTGSSYVSGAYYADGIIYILSSTDIRCTVYDISRDEVYSVYLPWTVPAYNTGSLCSTLTKTLFIPYYSLGIISYQGFDKYDFGGKYFRDIFYCDYASRNQFVYDDRFISFTASCMKIQDGTITKTFIQDQNHIQHIDVSKTEYRIIKNVNIT